MPRAGIEPARMISPQDFKSCASTYFAIGAQPGHYYYIFLLFAVATAPFFQQNGIFKKKKAFYLFFLKALIYFKIFYSKLI